MHILHHDPFDIMVQASLGAVSVKMPHTFAAQHCTQQSGCFLQHVVTLHVRCAAEHTVVYLSYSFLCI